MTQADFYGIFTLIITGITLYVIYKNRQQNISLKRFLIAIPISFLFFALIGIFSVTLCYSNPITLIFIITFLIFLSILIMQSKKYIQQLAMALILEFFAMNVLFRSVADDHKYTTSLFMIEDINKMNKDRGKEVVLSAKPLWHTSFTGLYEVVRKYNN